MSRTTHICLMASYNEWMNAKVYAAAATLSEEALAADRKAFFGSIVGTLNHLAIADRIWLKRFAAHTARYAALEPVLGLPAPTSLDQLLFADFRSLAEHRKWLDGVIVAWARSVVEADLDHVLRYSNIKGVAMAKSFFSALMHFFNHQTHHRGQATTLLTQAGADVGVTDLIALVPDIQEP